MINNELLTLITIKMQMGESIGPLAMNEETYNAIPALRRSDLARMYHNREIIPAMYKYLQENPPAKTDALITGSAAHKYILEPFGFGDEYAVWDNSTFDKTTKAGKEAWANFVENLNGRTPINKSGDSNKIGYDDMHEMRVALLSGRNGVADILINGDKEKVYVWKDEVTGLWLKCKPDIIGEIDDMPYCIDYKTCTDASPIGFAIDAKKYMYDMQVAFYLDGVEAVTGSKLDFAFIAQEKKPPYLSAIYTCPEEMYENGLRMYRTALGILKDCMDSDNWYGYEGKFNSTADLPWFDRFGGATDDTD